MEWWAYLYLAVVTAVMIYLIYRYLDLNLKVKRQRRRYDLLLKGRGELNLEELLKAHSHDIDVSVKRLKLLETNVDKIDEELKSSKSFLDSKMVDLNNNTNTTLIGKTDRQYSDLDKKLENINSILDKRIETNVNKFNSDIGKLNTDIITKLSNLDSNINTKLNSLDDKYNNRVNNVDAKFTNEVGKINTDRAAQYKKISERHEFDVSNLKKLDEENYNKLIEFINKQDKAIDDNLGFAIQQVSLYKYNALRNQTGDLSFTLVLLDRMNNGLMLTSINGRDASYTYSKEIVDGKCLVDISPEEENALKMVLKNN